MIPSIIHRVWLGRNPLSLEASEFEKSFRRYNPEWKFHLWTDDDITILPNYRAVLKAKAFSSKSNIVRIDVVNMYGGVYVDTDVECLKPLDKLLHYPAFAGRQSTRTVCNAVFGAVARHPWLIEMSTRLESCAELPPPWGPQLFTESVQDRSDVVILPKETFYPWLWDQPRRSHCPDSFTAHYWNMTWRPGKRIIAKVAQNQTNA